jgi:hypothetical protein
MERETGIEPATFSLGSGVGNIFSRAYPAFVKIHEPIEPAICKGRKIWTKFGPRSFWEAWITIDVSRRDFFCSPFERSCCYDGRSALRSDPTATCSSVRKADYTAKLLNCCRDECIGDNALPESSSTIDGHWPTAQWQFSTQGLRALSAFYQVVLPVLRAIQALAPRIN